MSAVEIISLKRDKKPLSTAQINWFIAEYTADRIPDYQAAAWLMAVVLNGMTRQETSDLTLAMVRSGDQADLSDVVPYAVDKHSTGGVGDKTSLVVLPIVVACGIPVAKMSGRSLGHTGGTLDKLESIAGFQVELSIERFKQLAKENHLVIAGQTANLAPADRNLYALRDVTGTIPSIPLIASSIMSKKIASGTDAIVLDVKVGEGSFMKSLAEARGLATAMVEIGVDAGKAVTALLSDMSQPLGITAGNALEVREAIETLHGEGPNDFTDHVIEIAAQMIVLSPHSEYQTIESARDAARQAIQDGSAFGKFRTMVAAQGGDVRQVDNPELLPTAEFCETITAAQSGYIERLDALQIGQAVIDVGGGRETKGAPIDHAVGVETLHKIGDQVNRGDIVFRVHANDQARLARAIKRLHEKALAVATEPVEGRPLFYDTISGSPSHHTSR
ncbi:MAG: thymidine phosphorylase [Chloroflexi bacterium]|nr:thymidine phosphorylase [Chloroflexota bacterium]